MQSSQMETAVAFHVRGPRLEYSRSRRRRQTCSDGDCGLPQGPRRPRAQGAISVRDARRLGREELLRVDVDIVCFWVLGPSPAQQRARL